MLARRVGIRSIICAAAFIASTHLSSAQTTAALDPQVLTGLRSGGEVLFIRHGKSDPTQADVDTKNLTNCATQRNLTEEGRAQAKAIGDGLRQLGVPVGRVVSSEYCRALETARLAGFADIEKSIDVSEPQNVPPVESQRRAAALRALLAKAPAAGTDTVIVSHRPNILDALGKDYFDIAEGEIIIFQPVAEAPGYKMLARIPRPEMLAQAAAISPH